MKRHSLIKISLLIILFSMIFITLMPAEAAEMALDYLYRYEHQSGEPDHLLDAIAIDSNRAIVCGNRGLALIDLNALPLNGTKQYLYRLTGLNARDVYLKYPYVYVNLHRGESEGPYGFAVVKIEGNTLRKIKVISETNTLLEKMCIRDDFLYVAAHNKGIRIYNISDPENPTLTGRLDDGFVDAFAIDVANDTAFVADGGGGLKIVDVGDKSQPRIIAGETLETAVGTSETITCKSGRIYIGAGGAGVAVYQNGDLNSRKIYPIGGAAEDMCWIGDFLVVSNFHGITVLHEYSVGELTIVGGETTARRAKGTLRLCEGVGAVSDNRILSADWNYLDVYQIKSLDESMQPDINCDVQRIRFAPDGETKTVTVTNNGGGDLTITNVTSSAPGFFQTSFTGTTLSPGQSVQFEIIYNGSGTNAAGVISLASNDPDENPLPIQVFGRTSYLDPGEEAADFTLPALSMNHETGQMEEKMFTLSQHRGQIVWFQVYGSW